MQTQRTGQGPPSPPSDVDAEPRLTTLEARLERLEKELEGLQDALYRHEVLQDRENGELRRRAEQLAQSLGQDAQR
jgi:uncharacterized coiled-coil protein SlyX